MMKQVFIWFVCLLAAGVAACSDGGDKDDLQFRATRDRILADGADEVRFTVLSGGDDVTSEAVIKEQASGTALTGGKFVTSVAGTYSFVAEYNGMRSEIVTVIAEGGSGFKKNVLVMKFTAVGCTYCPLATHAIARAEQEVPGRICPVSVYGTLGNMKDFMIDEYIGSFQKQFKFGTNYPTVIIDHADKWNYNEGIAGMAFAKALNAPGKVGIALSTGWNGNDLTVEVKVKGSETVEYATNLVVAVLESNLYALQTGALTEEDHYHHHVVRHYLTDLYGAEQKIGKGTLTASSDYVKTFTYTVPAEFKKENLEVVAYVLKSSDKSALNCQKVAAGKGIDYEKL